tara:strand:- start:135 stop:1454 length:1320 start_codon:yes stop_codon:yes gene_type:complete
MNVTSLSDREYRKLLKKEIQFIRNNLVSDTNTLILNPGQITQDSVQSYLSSSSGSIVSHLISEAVIRSELKVSDSAELCLSIIVNMLDSMSKSAYHNINIKDLIENNQKLVTEAVSHIQENTEKINKKNYQKLLDQKIKNNNLKSKIRKTISLAGISKKVSLEQSNSISTAIKEVESYQFNILTGLSGYTLSTKWSRKDCNIFVIDGIIESVSEIHYLLEKASKNKESYVLFVRNVLPEVMSTVALNNARNTIDMVIVSVGMEIDTLNILNDISICSDTKLISSNTGDLISAELRKDPKKIKKVIVTSNRVEIYQEENINVKNHISYLRKKVENTHEIDLIELLEKRIKSLSSKKVCLRIGHDLVSEFPEAIEVSDKFFRSLTFVFRNGIYEEKDFNSLPFLNIKCGHIYGSASLVCAYLTALSCVKNVLSIGHVLLRD